MFIKVSVECILVKTCPVSYCHHLLGLLLKMSMTVPMRIKVATKIEMTDGGFIVLLRTVQVILCLHTRNPKATIIRRITEEGSGTEANAVLAVSMES